MRIGLMIVSNLIVSSLMAITSEDKERVQKLDDVLTRLRNSGAFSSNDDFAVAQGTAIVEAKALIHKALLDEKFDVKGSLLSIVAQKYLHIPWAFQEITSILRQRASLILT